LGGRQEAGLRLEGLLTRLFTLFDLEPNGPFRVVGEQIDGSFDLDREVYLLEAKWTAEPTNEAALLILRGKVEGKSQFTRGLFLSINGYTRDAVDAITRGKAPNFVMVDGSHLYRVLDGQIRLDVLLRRLIRHLAETGTPYLPAANL
jgi:Restriction endonuclease